MSSTANDQSLIMNKFIIKNKTCFVVVNLNAIVIEPELTPNFRTVIPLTNVVTARACYCRRSLKLDKLICECIKDANFSSSSSFTSSTASSSFSNNTSMSSSGPRLNSIRLFYSIPSGKQGWKITYLSLVPLPETPTQYIEEWISNISNMLNGFEKPKKLLVFVNPFGGKGNAPKIYKNKILPLFQLAGIEVESVITERADHAKDRIIDTNNPIDIYDGIICVGGDGMFAELLNGILIRTQKELDINYLSPETDLVKPSITIGVIPAGSTDAVAYGTSGINDPITSAVHIIFGAKVNIDVTAIHNIRDDGKLLRYATSFLGYGYFGDTLVDSEDNRWMGPKRYDWAGMKKILGHRLYSGEIKLYVSTNDGSPKDDNICTSDCPQCARSVLKSKNSPNLITEENQINKEVSCISIRGKFLAINAANMSCRCGMTKKGISPSAHIGNGCTDLILVSQCSRLNYLRYLMRTGFLDKSPFDLDFVDVYRVKEFEFIPILTPKGSDSSYKLSNASVWNCDGEIINTPAVRVKVHCQLVSVFGTGKQNRNMNSSLMACLNLPKKVRDNKEQKGIIQYMTQKSTKNSTDNFNMNTQHSSFTSL